MNQNKILIIILAISIAFSIYLVSFENFIFNSNYEEKYDSIPNSGEINKGLIGFFEGKNKLPAVFNDKEISHLIDVKELINRGRVVKVFLSLINLILLSLLINGSGNKLKELSKLSIFSGAFVFIIVIPFIFSKFSGLFLKFHLIFFPQGNFEFSLNSTLIKLFPEQFFYDALIKLISISFYFAVILIIIGFVLSKVSSD